MGDGEKVNLITWQLYIVYVYNDNLRVRICERPNTARLWDSFPRLTASSWSAVVCQAIEMTLDVVVNMCIKKGKKNKKQLGKAEKNKSAISEPFAIR